VFAGGTFDFATPFALLCAVGVVTGYALLGACWLTMKTEGEVAKRARAHAKVLLLAVLAFMAVVSVWTPLEFPRIRERWFSSRTSCICGRCRPSPPSRVHWRGAGSSRGRDIPPFLAAIVLFMLGYLGLAISVFPYLVPPSITIWDAAAAPASQIFMLLGTLPLLPIILIYTGFVYYVFRGKLKEGEGYH
jgi:cytochrome d ubiquinol oxidase subunit II